MAHGPDSVCGTIVSSTAIVRWATRSALPLGSTLLRAQHCQLARAPCHQAVAWSCRLTDAWCNSMQSHTHSSMLLASTSQQCQGCAAARSHVCAAWSRGARVHGEERVCIGSYCTNMAQLSCLAQTHAATQMQPYGSSLGEACVVWIWPGTPGKFDTPGLDEVTIWWVHNWLPSCIQQFPVTTGGHLKWGPFKTSVLGLVSYIIFINNLDDGMGNTY